MHALTNDAATSAWSTSGFLSRNLPTADFNPENENSKPSFNIGRGNGIESLPGLRQLIDCRPARISESQQSRDFVVSLTH